MQKRLDPFYCIGSRALGTDINIILDDQKKVVRALDRLVDDWTELYGQNV